MEKLELKILINAPPEVVYNVVIDNEHFRAWTAPFSPTSHFEGTWEKDSTMRFLSEDENGELVGMVSTVRENIPNQVVSLEHKGYLQHGKEVLEGEGVDEFKGSVETYYFTEKNGKTELKIETDIYITMKSYFEETWPKSLEVIKRISEDQFQILYEVFCYRHLG